MLNRKRQQSRPRPWSRVFASYDRLILAMVAFALLAFTLFLVAPLASLLIAPSKAIGLSYLSIYLNPPYVRLDSYGEWIKVIEREGHVKVIFDWVDHGVILNTFIASSLVTALSTFIGISVAYVMSRLEFFGKNLLRVMVIVPLLYTPFVNAFVAFKIFGPGGLFSEIPRELGLGFSVVVQGLSGMILAQTMMFWPIVYLNVYSSMVQIDPSLEEQAENLGARGFRLFRTVTLPLSLPGVAAGAGIVFLFSMEDLAAPIAFKVSNVMSMKIVDSIKSSITIEQLHPDAVVLSLIMVTVAVVWFLALKRYVGLRQYAMIVRGGRWTPRTRRPGILAKAVIYLLIFPWVLFSMTPQLGVLVYAFTEEWRGILPSGFTLDHFTYIFTDDEPSRALRNSLIYATAAVAIIIVLSSSSAYVVSRFKTKLAQPIDTLATIPLVIPGLALATGLIILFGFGPFKGTPLDPFAFGPALLLIAAYTIRKSPFTTRAVYAGLQQVHESLEEAALNLGASRSKTLFSIVIPLIGINVFSGALISFVYVMAEVSTSITIGLIDDRQAPLTAIMFDYLTGGYGGGNFINLVAAMASLILAVQLLVITLTNIVLKQRYAFIGV